MHIRLHQKTPCDGWQTVKTLPADSNQWNPTDRAWIQWLTEHDASVVTVGWTMYEVYRPRRPQ